MIDPTGLHAIVTSQFVSFETWATPARFTTRIAILARVSGTTTVCSPNALHCNANDHGQGRRQRMCGIAPPR
jgi:hypothetical protein